MLHKANDCDAARQLQDLQEKGRRLHGKVLQLAEMLEDIPALAAARGKAQQMLEGLEEKTRLIPLIAPGATLSEKQARDIADVAKSYAEMEQSCTFLLRILGDYRA